MTEFLEKLCQAAPVWAVNRIKETWKENDKLRDENERLSAERDKLMEEVEDLSQERDEIWGPVWEILNAEEDKLTPDVIDESYEATLRRILRERDDAENIANNYIETCEALRSCLAAAESEVADLSQHVCDECTPEGSGYIENRVEGRAPCACMLEAQAYQDLAARIATAEGLLNRSIKEGDWPDWAKTNREITAFLATATPAEPPGPSGVERLRADQAEWRKGVALIAAYLGDKNPSNLCCVRIANIGLRLHLDLQASDEAVSVHREEVERLRGLLSDCEWHQQGNNFAPSCPWCGRYKHEGHSEECELNTALAPESPDGGEGECEICGGGGKVRTTREIVRGVPFIKPCPECGKPDASPSTPATHDETRKE